MDNGFHFSWNNLKKYKIGAFGRLFELWWALENMKKKTKANYKILWHLTSISLVHKLKCVIFVSMYWQSIDFPFKINYQHHIFIMVTESLAIPMQRSKFTSSMQLIKSIRSKAFPILFFLMKKKIPLRTIGMTCCTSGRNSSYTLVKRETKCK